MNFQRDILPLKNILFRTALRITMNREEAEDVVQDTLLKLWERRDELSDVKNLEAFALTSARNLALDRKALTQNKVVSLNEELHDRENNYSPSVSNPTVWGASPQAQMERTEQLSSIHDAINSLPEKQRTIIQLRDIEGKTYKEIAEILAISESDVKVTLFRARGALRSAIAYSP